MYYEIIIGPPGTGKTTAIIARIQQYLAAGGNPDRVGYVSFTRKALHVARDRMAKQFGFGKSELPYFRTLHSMCFHLAGITPGQVVDKYHIAELSRALGLTFHGTGIKDEGVVEAGGPDSALLFHENLARLTKRTMRGHWEGPAMADVDIVDLTSFHNQYLAFKRKRHLVGFTDILCRGLVTNPPDLDLLLVDEAQDLSPVQWGVVHHLASNAFHTVIAGDANQAIYTWAGADAEYFVNLKGKQQVLDQGYRMARRPHIVANKIAERIQVKNDADFKPRTGARGRALALDCIADVRMDMEGDWLVLARTNHLLAKARAEVKEWHPNVKTRFSTIHCAKGAEADNVVLLTGMTEKCWRGYQDRPDDELRCWYVGASRARENLYVVPGQHATYQMDIEV